MKKILLIGGGGHAHSCIDVIEHQGTYQIAGIVDKNIGSTVLGYRVLGDDSSLPELIKMYPNVLICIGQIKSPQIRINLFNKLKDLNATFPIIISPRAHISKHAQIEEGTIIMHDALVNAKASIGKNCIINSKALIEHDSVIDDNVHVATGAIINGHCRIKEGSFIGSNTVLKQETIIEANTVIPFGVTYG